uniref:SLAIN motif-containing protein-like n=1 Tax=Syphacia muris TaxID=451379 RepID=A0A0N5ATN4_9BILA
MENDIHLVQQLLALGDSIQELKRSRTQSGSQSSLNSSECEEEDDLCTLNKPYSYNSQTSNTDVFLDDDIDDKPATNVFFSRKHSILRIPIAPRSSNRRCSIQKITRRASEIRSSRAHHPRLGSSQEEDLKCGVPSSVRQSFTSSSARASTGSIDSGIRDTESGSLACSSPSPTFKDQKF